MPRIADDTETFHIGGTNFQFTGTGLKRLGATEYTLVTIAVDVTGSTAAFAADLLAALKTALNSCKKSPRSDNLLARVVLFSTYVGGVSEVHGFKPLADIDIDQDYPALRPHGMTPLFDAVYSAVGATAEYGRQLKDGDFLANAIAFIVTDGADNASSATPKMIADKIDEIRREEKLESIHTVLIGINAAQARNYLEDFQRGAKIDQYVDVADASAGHLAKLADFVSQSVSSTSQAVGTGGASQTISPSI